MINYKGSLIGINNEKEMKLLSGAGSKALEHKYRLKNRVFTKSVEKIWHLALRA